MASNSINQLSGYGLGFRPPHYSHVIENKPKIDFFEIISENFMLEARRPHFFLEKLREIYPVSMHGVSLSIGSKGKLSEAYLKRLKELADWLNPAFVSDHLCFTHVGSHNSHDLLPIALTQENLKNISERLDFVQNYLGRKILLENPSAYVAHKNDAFAEHEFFNELFKRTGCGILLDINNLFVNQFNLGVDARQYVSNLNTDAIGYFHLSGHTRNESVIIDTHDHPVSEDVWTLYREVKASFPQIPVLLEWDDNIPSFEILEAELDKARVFNSEAAKHASAEKIVISDVGQSKQNELPSEETLFSAITGPSVAEIPERLRTVLSDSTNTPPSDGFMVYHNAYYSRIVSVMKEIYPALFFIMEDEGFSQTVCEYLQEFHPDHFSVSWVGQYLPQFLSENSLTYDFGVDREILSDLARLEWLQVESFNSRQDRSSFDVLAFPKLKDIAFERSQVRVDKSVRLFESNWNMVETFRSIQEGVTPPKPILTYSYAFISAPHGKVSIEGLNKEEYLLMREWLGGSTILRSDVSEAQVHFASQLFVKLLKLDLITEVVQK